MQQPAKFILFINLIEFDNCVKFMAFVCCWLSEFKKYVKETANITTELTVEDINVLVFQNTTPNPEVANIFDFRFTGGVSMALE